MQPGFEVSYTHPENGMTQDDMLAIRAVARRSNEVIIFRSTGPWSQRWLERGYPSKNFHVKGKSSDWGPQAGLVPHLGEYSKVGHDEKQAKKGTENNEKGIHEGFAEKKQLRLSGGEIQMQLTRACERPERTALRSVEAITKSDDLLLVGERSGDGRLFAFQGVKAGDKYDIYVFPPEGGPFNSNPIVIKDRLNSGKGDTLKRQPFAVMCSKEVNGEAPMTGDYDLLAVCPRWEDYMSRASEDISKPGLNIVGKGVQPGAHFARGSAMDKVLDMRLHTGGKNTPPSGRSDEHPDMGNLTPRILRAINALNVEMGAVGLNAARRRVHHNAESHRHALFGAITAVSMEAEGDGFPFTCFHPARATAAGSPLQGYGEVCTLESLGEFRQYAARMQAAGWFTPKNWCWGMSIRDNVKSGSPAYGRA